MAGGEPIDITANLYFAIASTMLLAGVAAYVTAKVIEPRLGPYNAAGRAWWSARCRR